MKLLDGKQCSERMLAGLKDRIARLPVQPGLGVILVGDDPASHLYVRLKSVAAQRLGITLTRAFFPKDARQEEVEQAIEKFNADRAIHGILLQLPLPAPLDTDTLISRICPEKDADGFHPQNESRLFAGEETLPPVFPQAILELLRLSEESLPGKRAVVLGNSKRFLEVMVRLLSDQGVSLETFLPDKTPLSEETVSAMRAADIVVSACGKPNLISGGMLKVGAVVIDGGIVQCGTRVMGDVDRASTEGLDIFLSPVPGGVGPVTIACLLSNVVTAAERFSVKV
ncbi:MAG: bifunctional 5,10-methylenetetrahydrofolate dehydrogenase/5,10-methenyltetrahydrofolate cyclohydrolase [Candidatus Moraniibacteriota bacterium]|nr:MAG: bifunctional 5,10-methylenetetrahydrofolate dehydrogenase/5,10-methenyltetrahydrofolate cyclohydrolase [Candidatus Moranbacteria bacterium]